MRRDDTAFCLEPACPQVRSRGKRISAVHLLSFVGRHRWSVLAGLIRSWLAPVRALPLVLATLCGIGTAQAAGEVTELETRETPTTPSRYTVGDTTYEWGAGSNVVLDGFSSNGERYAGARSAAGVEIRRVDLAGVATGEPCAIFAESTGDSRLQLAPDFPAAPGESGNCDTAALLADDLVNRGVLDLFSNRPPTAKNIERVDYLFRPALHAPFGAAAGALAGHLVGDKSGNNPVQIAAILALDQAGMPSAFGPLVRIGKSGCSAPAFCFSVTGLVHDYTFLKSASIAPQGRPTLFSTFVEPVGLAYVSTATLGLGTGQRYHGVSLFPEDVDAARHDLLDPSTYPSDTEDEERSPGDSVDVYGGGGRQYVSAAASTVGGRVSCSVGADEVVGRGLADIDLMLYTDTNGNGALDPDADLPLGDALASDADGAFELVGLSDGSYFLVLDESDVDLPAGATLASDERIAFPVVAGAAVDGLDFTFDCASVEPPIGPLVGPMANDDSVEIRQSAPGAPLASTGVDVLLNDTHPLGQTLTVVAASGATQGTVTVTDDADAVLYTPAAAAFGQDSFDYTVEDDEGRQDSATVTVSFSLISSDPTCFEGAPSDACALRTEVDGHGFGSLWWPAIAALLAAIAGRRWSGRRAGRGGHRP